jgi:hypothetical protein
MSSLVDGALVINVRMELVDRHHHNRRKGGEGGERLRRTA